MQLTRYGPVLLSITLSGIPSTAPLVMKHHPQPLATGPPAGQWFEIDDVPIKDQILTNLFRGDRR